MDFKEELVIMCVGFLNLCDWPFALLVTMWVR